MIVLYVNGAYVFAMPDTPIEQIANADYSSVVRFTHTDRVRFTVMLYPKVRTVGDLMAVSQKYVEGLASFSERIARMATPSRRWVSGQEAAKVLSNGKHGERYVLYWEFLSSLPAITERNVGRERVVMPEERRWVMPKRDQLEHGVLM